MAWRITRHLLSILGIVVLGGLLSATLVRFSPGFGTDEQQLDSRLNSSSLQALHQSREGEQNVGRFYLKYLAGIAGGNLGRSHSLGQPVLTLLRDRSPVTLRLVAMGLSLGWLLALALALSAVMLRIRAYSVIAIAISGGFLCVPAAVLALVSVLLSTPGYLAIALIVFPKLFAYTRNLLVKAYASPHIVTAKAKGLGEIRILLWHVLPLCGEHKHAASAHLLHTGAGLRRR